MNNIFNVDVDKVLTKLSKIVSKLESISKNCEEKINIHNNMILELGREVDKVKNNRDRANRVADKLKELIS